jgi:hypothetical protein
MTDKGFRPMNKENLLILADFLEKEVHEKQRFKFDYSCYLGEDWNGSQDLSCGTTACAMGITPQIPKFKKYQLYYDTAYRTIENAHPVSNMSIRSHAKGQSQYATTPETGCWLFDISRNLYDYLFFPGTLPDWPEPGPISNGSSPPEGASALEVAQHIRFVVSMAKPDAPAEGHKAK